MATNGTRTYKPVLTAEVNRKGVLDVDTVKGCTYGMLAHPGRGCYGVCYACRQARCRGFDFGTAVSRQPTDDAERAVEGMVRTHCARWFRIGTMGDPSHDWPLTLYVAEWLGRLATPVVVTKHWTEMPSAILRRLVRASVVFNTSCSALDSDTELRHRIGQFYRIRSFGGRSCLRVVTARFGQTGEGRSLAERQKWILMHGPVIDTPLRIPASDPRVISGTVIVERIRDLDTEQTISRHDASVYIGHCDQCIEQCGVDAV